MPIPRTGPTHTTVPPFATDLPDSAYQTAQRVRRQPAERKEPRPTSAYDHYADMLDNDENEESSAAGIGAGFMNADASDDESDEEEQKYPPSRQANLVEAIKRSAVPLASPRPGYASKPPVLDTPPIRSPPGLDPPPGPMRTPQSNEKPLNRGNVSFARPQEDQQMDHSKPTRWADTIPGHTMEVPASVAKIPFHDSPQARRPIVVDIAPSIPISAHGDLTLPIKAVFNEKRDSVRFDESASYLRGAGEGRVIPRRGAPRDDFWRRFSVIAKKEDRKKERSSWLRTNQSGKKAMSRMVWIVSLLIVLGVAGGIGLWWYYGRNGTTESSHTQPEALGGATPHGSIIPSSTSKAISAQSTSSSPHVSPTYTVARRDIAPPIPTSHHKRRVRQLS